MTSSMKHSTSCSHRESSCPSFEGLASSLRRLINSAECFTMRDSDRASILLCREVDRGSAFARAGIAYSFAISRLEFRPVLRTGSISVGGRMFRRGHLYATMHCYRPAIVSQPLCSLCTLSNPILDRRRLCRGQPRTRYGPDGCTIWRGEVARHLSAGVSGE
jgi:hypothetical protein